MCPVHNSFVGATYKNELMHVPGPVTGGRGVAVQGQ